MLPLRGLRLAVSKSNSSSRVPSTTTTRVSSGWLASMSMRRAMARSRGVGSQPARATGGQAASVVRGGRCAIDPSNGQLLAKTGKHRAAGPLTRSCQPRVSYSHRLPDSPSADPPCPHSRWGRQPGPARNCRRPPPPFGHLPPLGGGGREGGERRRLLADRNIRGSPVSDNQNIAPGEYCPLSN